MRRLVQRTGQTLRRLGLAADEIASRRSRHLPLYWRIFAYALAASAVVGLAIVLFFPAASGLFLFGLYSIPSNSAIPLPHEPGLLFFAKFYHPVWIALAGTLGTAIAAFADYELVGRAMQHPKISGARETRVYQWACRWLMARPFVTVVIFAATPLPVYVVRVLAPASGYSIGRYVAAMMVGRFPRFLAVAWLGYVVPIPAWVLGLMFVMLVLPFLFTSLTNPDSEEGAGDQERIAILDSLEMELEPQASSSTRIPAASRLFDPVD
ncbi:MAG: VTT domain-containing protein [Proteobacteria bacterium]|nr:VTT domain-containing protein [Pseudomonadota bacterium]